MGSLRIRLLGSLEAFVGERPLSLAGPKQRAVLAMLALHPRETVTTEHLIEGLWGDSPPPTAAKMVQIYISQLRKALAADSACIVTRMGGYELHVDPDDVDATQFERLVGDSLRTYAAGGRGDAAREALTLWGEAPLRELADEPFAADELRRLEELRLTALELAIDTDLDRGRHRDTIPELQALVLEHPLRERLHAQLMLALYRAGRQADALAAYRRARRLLVDEVGLEPAPELQRLHEAILRQEPKLELQAVELPAELDVGNVPIFGRGVELSRLRVAWRSAWAGQGRVVALVGAEGMGKTRLAAEIAAEAHDAGSAVFYVSGNGGPLEARRSLSRAAATTRPTVVVADDLDSAGDAVIGACEAACVVARRRPLLALLTFRDHESRAARSLVPRVSAVGGELLALSPIDEGAVAAIAERYAGDQPVPAARILALTGGVPRRVHEAAATWGRDRLAGRLASNAVLAAAQRTRLHSLERDLVADVVRLKEGRERAAAAGATTGSPTACPFKGLAPFEEADAAYFFGRERLVGELVARLAGSALLAVVGSSGSGKSSVLHAGLIPALRDGILPGSERWRCVSMRPGEHPCAELRRVLDRPGDEAPATALMRAGERWDRLVLTVDQFEEVFTACPDDAERRSWVDGLVEAARDGEDRVLVVLGLRSDFYGRCAAYPALAGMLARHHVLVGPPDPDELRRAITGPARVARLLVEPPLVDALAAEVAGRPGGLPLLSSALVELWEHRDGRRLTLAAHRRTGGVRGAVARRAEQGYGALAPVERTVARRILLRLCKDGAPGQPAVRRRVALTEFDADGDDAVAGVLGTLAGHRLITLEEGWAELGHEALVTEWPRLRRWLEADGEGRRVRGHLATAARDWHTRGRDAADLYRGSRLLSALEWASEHGDEPNALEHAFLREGRRESEQEAVAARRTTRRLGALLAGVAVLLALAVVAGIAALEQREAAGRSATRAEAERLGARALLESRLDRSLLLARSAVELADSPATRGNLLAALMRSPAAIAVMHGDGDRILTLDVSPDGRTLAIGDDSGTLLFVDAHTRRLTGPAYAVAQSRVASVEFSPDGRSVAVGGSGARGGFVHLVDVRTHRLRAALRPAGDAPVQSLAFAPGGSSLAVLSATAPPGPDPARVERWRPGAGDARPPVARVFGRAGATGVGFRRDGSRIVVASEREGVRELDAETLRPVRVHRSATASILAVSRDGRTAALGRRDGALELLDLRTGALRRASGRHENAVQTLAFSRDGRTLVSGGDDQRTMVWDARTARLRDAWGGHAGRVLASGVAPDGRTAYTGGLDATVIAWDLQGARRLGTPFRTGIGAAGGSGVMSPDGSTLAVAKPGHVALVDTHTLRVRGRLPAPSATMPAEPAFAPDGRALLVGGSGGFAGLYDARSGRLVGRLPRLDGDVVAAAVGRRTMITASDDGRVRAWSRAAAVVPSPLRSPAAVGDVSLSPDERRFVLGLRDGRAEIYDARTRERVARLDVSDRALTWVGFTPDGRRLITGDLAGVARLWSTRDWEPIGRPMVGHAGSITAAPVTADGRLLATSGTDGTVRLWDVATQNEVGSALPGVHNTPVAAALSPDGAYAFASYQDGSAWRWDIRVESWKRHACEVAGRNLSVEEWERLHLGRAFFAPCAVR